MNNTFNLFLLNKESDAHPRSWICISGKNIKEIISEIEMKIINKKKINREQISKLISKNLVYNHVSIKNLLRGKVNFYPIPVILELCKISEEENKYKDKLHDSIDFLKINSASGKPIKAVKLLSKNLAKIIGTFCADGSLSVQFIISHKNKEKLLSLEKYCSYKIKYSFPRKEYYLAIQMNKSNYNELLKFSEENTEFNIQTHYNIDLTDEHKSSVEAFNRWIYEEFEIKPTSFHQKDVAWRTIFSNKILSRYLISFFGFLPGYKTNTVSEPELIKRSDFKIRKEFAKGVIMFDGCITHQKRISFSTISPKLAQSIKEIWNIDRVIFSEHLDKRGSYNLTTNKNNKKEKLLEYFEPETQKWNLLNWLHGDLSQEVKISEQIKKTSIKEILNRLNKVKICDSQFLMDIFYCSHTTIRDYLKIFASQRKINLSDKPAKISDFVSDSATIMLRKDFHDIIFGRLKSKFITYENLSRFFEIHKTTLSAWKVRKNRIPLKTAKMFCEVLQINNQELYNNVEKLDREIVEII